MFCLLIIYKYITVVYQHRIEQKRTPLCVSEHYLTFAIMGFIDYIRI